MDLYLRLHLDVIEANARRTFHIDAVTARLICTYRGGATQCDNGVMGAKPNDIRDVSTSSPMILRGTSWRSAVTPGLLHRSPPIEGTGQTKLVLVLDPIVDIKADRLDGHLHWQNICRGYTQNGAQRRLPDADVEFRP